MIEEEAEEEETPCKNHGMSLESYGHALVCMFCGEDVLEDEEDDS